MIKHFCDRCKKEIDYRNTRILCISNAIDPYKNNDNDIQAERVYELCTTCVNKVLDVILDAKLEEAVGTKQEKRKNENSFNEWFFNTTHFLGIPAGCEIRIHNIILRNKKDNLGLFAQCTDDEIKSWRNCGSKTSKQIIAMRDAAKRSVGCMLDRMDARSRRSENDQNN